MMARFNSTTNRGGRRAGARNKLQTDFLRDLAEAWALEGKGALRIMVKEEPSMFVQVCASLMPKEVAVDVSGPLADLSDDELLEALQAVKELRARTIELEANSEKAREVEEEAADGRLN
ncbi:MAG: hypothetical protein ACXWCX_27820 [Burkholderiales bacterium]